MFHDVMLGFTTVPRYLDALQLFVDIFDIHKTGTHVSIPEACISV
jgi:hypothetical protein